MTADYTLLPQDFPSIPSSPTRLPSSLKASLPVCISTSKAGMAAVTRPRPTRRIWLLCAIAFLSLLVYASSWSIPSSLVEKGRALRIPRDGSRRESHTPTTLLPQALHQDDILPLSPSQLNHPSSPSSSSNASSINPTCRRTLLYRFAGSHGFASEYLIFLRIAMLAKIYGYALFIDDSKWNYGHWNEYIHIFHLIC